MALGDIPYLQSVNHDLKQPGLLPPSSREMENKQLGGFVELKASYRIIPTTPPTRAIHETQLMVNFISSLTGVIGSRHYVPLVYILSWLIKRISGNLTLGKNLNPNLPVTFIGLFVCLFL